MTYPQAIVATAGIIAAAAVITQGTPIADTLAFDALKPTGTFHFMQYPNVRNGVWRLNTRTGELHVCKYEGGSVRCSNEYRIR